MTLVDTSVWIDFFANRNKAGVRALTMLLDQEEAIAFTGLILQELMQGCPDNQAAAEIEKYFSPFVEIFPQRDTYNLAAHIYRNCRRHGLTIRTSVDCLIAACAMQHNCALLHNDRDFTHIARIEKLQIANVSG